jgi:hypothetical protein
LALKVVELHHLVLHADHPVKTALDELMPLQECNWSAREKQTSAETSMLIWDLKWKSHQQQLSNLNRIRLKRLALASIEWVVDLGITMVDPIKEEFSNAFLALKSGMHYSCDDLETLIQDVVQPGVYDISMAVVTLSQNLDSIDEKVVFDALSYCYQAVLDREILTKLERETMEDDVNKLELENASCMECIQKQLELLDLANHADLPPISF